MDAKSKTIEKRQASEKAALIAQFKKMPIIHIACEKAAVSRATFYRWRNEDAEFCKQAQEALTEGEALITDLSESQLISLIKDRKFPAVHLWLRHHHPKYGDKVEVITRNAEPETLTPEQEVIVKKALKLANLIKSTTHHEPKKS